MGDQDTKSWLADAAAQLRDPLNAGVAAQMQRSIEIEAQNVVGFIGWLASNAMHLAPTTHPTMGGKADESFFLKLSIPTVLAGLMDGQVRGGTLEAARDVLLQRYLEDDDTQARIVERARKLALDAVHDAQVLRGEHGALFQRLSAVAEVA